MHLFLPRHLTSLSGADDEHPVSNLQYQGPANRGWQTPRFCSWPQEVVLRLPTAARLRKIQILSHQHKIGMSATTKKLNIINLVTQWEPSFLGLAVKWKEVAVAVALMLLSADLRSCRPMRQNLMLMTDNAR